MNQNIAQSEKQRVAVYCRVSTVLPSQRLSAISQQNHGRNTVLNAPTRELAGIYADSGVSGVSRNGRISLQRMVSDCKAGKIDLVLTKSVSRLARNTTDCLELARTLLTFGVHIVFEKENIRTGSADGELMLSILACFAEEESRSISENLKWGIRKRFASGSYQPSVAPFGYRKSDGRLAIEPEEATVVRSIFEGLINGTPPHVIAAGLNESRVATRRGAAWSYTQIRSIVNNPVYMGDLLCQKTYTDERFCQRLNRGMLDRYYHENHHEPIVDRKTFALAASVFEQIPCHARTGHPLCGRVVCAVCGCPMFRRQSKGAHTFVCASARRHSAYCHSKPERESTIRAAFLTLLNKLAFSQQYTQGGILNGYIAHIAAQEIGKGDAAAIAAAQERSRMERAALAAEAMAGHNTAQYHDRCRALLAGEERLRREAVRLHCCTEQAERLRAFVETWRITGDVADFPDEAFPNLVSQVRLVSGSSATFCFACGLTLTEDITNRATKKEKTGDQKA